MGWLEELQLPEPLRPAVPRLRVERGRRRHRGQLPPAPRVVAKEAAAQKQKVADL